MNDMQTIAKILVVIREGERVGAVNMALLDEKSLGISGRERDNLVIKIQRAGLIEGVITTEDIDNAPNEVLWDLSHPCVTFEGIKYMSNNSDFKKAVKEIANTWAQTLIGALCSKYI